jgi:hypothetical protein
VKSIKLALIYGLLVWVVPFAVAFLIFPLRASERPLFESIMPVVVTLATVLFAVLYFKKVETAFLKEGVLLGFVFLVVSVAIDLVMFSRGPMAMPLMDYVKDIGITYLLVPIITIGFGYILGKKHQ